jgi:hypothetical protein
MNAAKRYLLLNPDQKIVGSGSWRAMESERTIQNGIAFNTPEGYAVVPDYPDIRRIIQEIQEEL